MTQKLVYYDKENDIFVVHKGFSSDEKFKGNIEAGQLILDISTKERVVGIEIMRATAFFKLCNIHQKVIEELEDARFIITMKPNGFILKLGLKTKQHLEEIPATIAVPLEIQPKSKQ